MVSRTSRKKSKGKERKAKKAEVERFKKRDATWLGWAIGDPVGRRIECSHGCDIPMSYNQAFPDPMHLVMCFLDELYTPNLTIDNFLNALHMQKHLKVWQDGEYRAMLLNIFIRMGTNMMLHAEKRDTHGASLVATIITILEQLPEVGSLDIAFNGRRTRTKMRDLNTSCSSNRRDRLKFYSKRISCSCLKGMYQEARRTIPKMGLCYHCDQEKERVALSVCSRCMVEHYCSRECQVADWHRHEGMCDVYVRAHLKQVEG